MMFDFLPEEVAVSEAFFKFKLANMGLEQLFLFAGKVAEPKVAFSTSRIDFHSVLLGGEGYTETVYLENQEHLPFIFSFDRSTLMHLEGPSGAVVDIQPKSGTVAPHGRCPIVFTFKPQEEIIYNFNLNLDIKRKPNKLSINLKGEGYAVHPLIQLEQSEEQMAAMGAAGTTAANRFITLRPAPAMNYADFGAVQVLDTLTKKLTVSNTGKYNFDYLWDTDAMGDDLALTGGKMGGTLQKAGMMEYSVTFSPQREGGIDGSMLSFTVAGKYTYNIAVRGSGVKPALRFSFMQHDFGSCFITVPGGATITEEAVLRITNHDPSSTISIECTFQKTRALWVDCPPIVLEPGITLDVPISFAPRDVKDYVFAVPFVVNGTGKVTVNVLGKGIQARLEMANASQRRLNFGVVNVGSEVRKTVALVNKSKRPLAVQLIDEGGQYGGSLLDHGISFTPQYEVIVAPRETLNAQVIFTPNKRVATFSDELMIRYAGVTHSLLTVSGKAQGAEVSLDTDSLPFGAVVEGSQKIRRLVLDNSGDIPITFQWLESTFGSNFSISPLAGKLAPGNEVAFEVTFKPQSLDEDIRQDNILLTIPGMAPLQLTCSGACVPQPSGNTQTLQFNSLARKEEVKSIKFQNPTDKDWFLTPSLDGDNWRVPHEIKVPAKGTADLSVTYFPLTMSLPPKEATAPAGKGKDAVAGKADAYAAAAATLAAAAARRDSTPDTAHKGQLFVSLPDGSAQLFHLRGYAGQPESVDEIFIDVPAKKAATTSVKLKNWLGSTQKFQVSIELLEKPSPATFVIVANAVEVGPNGVKEFPIRWVIKNLLSPPFRRLVN
jgi:hydrocephalus-inducing protein